ncbi:beta-ketoacyl synthase N-terminal-like domain-containing protein [Tenacibaculum maritimum]|uniref:beta-ketoacyl synthase N-terminal-like domain-containing protein n=1 Tax=Tenacibaculum maritimum TaxID=107401 RepID=UPI0012E69D23|nr:beta-ketoacyl synthase N-terminal-like domain-containing protein [Tenacibaculum maritimum]CAA0149094.1 3-oxoacyl-(acyl-carrier-protein) synthase [Tenacibaculum maritimum]CAA0216412.1 3-oxoacyl-(acyl-carrier-protein) synthase [Tenacibaculum maritimum]
MKKRISITSIASISALGSNQCDIWENYQQKEHYLSIKKFDGFEAWVAQLAKEDLQKIEELRNSDNKYKNLDATVLYALSVARKAVADAAWKPSDNFGINIGSSRGATFLFEKYHKEYLETNKVATLSSPTTTLGNISSWIAHDLQTAGPDISHSITCSTGLHSVLNGVAWLQAGLSDKFLVGASEAALTSFTVAQMQALKVYAKQFPLKEQEVVYPCRAFDLNKEKNTMVLGEGAAVICLEKGVQKNAIAFIEGIGYATEMLKHNISISAEAVCFQKSMKMALKETAIEEVDVIVMHAPGTIKGDLSEMKAIGKVFKNQVPFLTTNKWKLGHTFATSGILSMELAILMLKEQQVVAVPFVEKQIVPQKVRKVLVNAVGFGGNAVSVLLTK